MNRQSGLVTRCLEREEQMQLRVCGLRHGCVSIRALCDDTAAVKQSAFVTCAAVSDCSGWITVYGSMWSKYVHLTDHFVLCLAVGLFFPRTL